VKETSRPDPHHVPSDAAKARAEAAGMDLDALRSENRELYEMLNAEAVVRVSPTLAHHAVPLIPNVEQRSIFSVPGEPAVRILAFPPLTTEEQAQFDDAAARLVASEPFRDHLAFFRTVRDPHGEHRELMLPMPPDAWNGEVVLVGPFTSQEQAEAWPAGRLPSHLIADPMPYLGHWFCDVFDSEDAWVEAQATNESPT